MTVYYSRWLNANDRIGEIVENTWLGFVEELATFSRRQVASKEDNLLFGYRFNGDGRKIEHFVSADFIALDLDHDVGLAEFDSILTDLKLEAVLYTSWSHTPENEKLRLVIPLAEPVRSCDDYQALWRSMNVLCGGRLDPSTKNANRILYYPCRTHFSQFAYYEGGIATAAELCAIWPVVEPDFVKTQNHPRMLTDKQRVATAIKRTEMKHNSIYATNLVNTNWLNEYWSSTDNWYGEMFRLLCRIAIRARYNDWPLDRGLLADIMQEVDRADIGGPHYAKKGRRYYETEAQDAINWALQQNFLENEDEHKHENNTPTKRNT